MFDWLKERLGKKENYNDIKEHILSEPFAKKPLWQERREEPDQFAAFKSEKQAADFPAETGRSPFERKDLAPALDTRLDDEPPSIPAFPKSSRFSPQSRADSTLERTEKLEKLEDLLMFMKEQLSAIKAQNDMMNERLKNLERTLVPERY